MPQRPVLWWSMGLVGRRSSVDLWTRLKWGRKLQGGHWGGPWDRGLWRHGSSEVAGLDGMRSWREPSAGTNPGRLGLEVSSL
eukprot:13741921-Heterocapsa_arctica.AAC.1